MREFSWLAVLLGVVIGALLAMANAFIGLKVGMTISASIPAAVMSLLILRTLLKRGTLLESNMVQTIGSAGESVATGMIFTIPALFIMGENPQYLEMVIWGAIGGLLGVCFMVPLRHVLIVKEHGKLPYPEGVACAEVLQSGERGGTGAKSVLWGAIVGAFYYLVTGLGFWRETAVVSIKPIKTEAQLESSPALLGVGYILGARIAAYMLAGAVLSWFILIPSIAFFGADVANPVYPETTRLIADMQPQDLYGAYVRYIGAGAVAIGGLISLFKSTPTILSSFWHILLGVFGSGRGKRTREERDIPFPLLLVIIAGLAYAMWSFDAIGLDHVGVIAVLIFTFLFVTVSSRLVGIVGSSSNPVSGMTIATLLATALVYKFFVMGDTTFTEPELNVLKVRCLFVGAIACIAITIGGDTSQDLKTGFLVKATPYKQQLGEMIGVMTSVIAVAGLLLLLNSTYGFTPDRADPLPAYQANIMKLLVDGVLGGQVPWTLIAIGGAAAVIVELMGLPALPFAVGMYLPLGLSTPIMAGGAVRWLVDRKKKESTEHDPGVLTASGMVAGMGLMGVAFAGVLALIAWGWSSPKWLNPFDLETTKAQAVSYAHLVPWLWQNLGGSVDGETPSIAFWYLSSAWWKALPAIPFAALTMWLWWCGRKRLKIVLPTPEPSAPPLPAPSVPPSTPPAPTPNAPTQPPPAPIGMAPEGLARDNIAPGGPGSDSLAPTPPTTGQPGVHSLSPLRQPSSESGTVSGGPGSSGDDRPEPPSAEDMRIVFEDDLGDAASSKNTDDEDDSTA